MLVLDRFIERLAIGNSWIGQRSERIRGLRFLLTEAQHIGGAKGLDFVNALIERLVFLTSDEFDSAIYEMAEYIDATFDLSTTIICSATADHEKDSGQRVLYDLCSALGLLGHTKIHSVNRYDHVQKTKIVPTDVVLIDEFIGTGRSFLGRSRTMRKQFESGKKSVPRIHGLAVVGMSDGLRRIAHGFESLGVCKSLLKGIQGMSPKHQMSAEYALMSLFEDHLQSNILGYELPRLGDGACEALYSRTIGNCPNSVFPFFWWTQDSSGHSRNPLFSRVL